MQIRRLMMRLSDCNGLFLKSELQQHFNAKRIKLPGCGRFAAFVLPRHAAPSICIAPESFSPKRESSRPEKRTVRRSRCAAFCLYVEARKRALLLRTMQGAEAVLGR